MNNTDIKKKFFNNYISRRLLDIALKLEKIQKQEINNNAPIFFKSLSSIECDIEELEIKINKLEKGE